MWITKVPNFSPNEMACKNCSCGGESHMNEEFMVKLQELRDARGFALPVNSGFRCSVKNKRVNGHPTSGHLDQDGKGAMAADLKCDRDRARIVIQKAIEMGFSVGIQQRGESRYVHVDSKIRKSGKPNLWSYA